jgi:ATP-dependent RNA helicase DDX55/SPB4
LKKNQVGGLIISPTRELASQTHEVLSKFLKNVKQFSSVLLVGGNPVVDDVKQIQTHGVNIIIATPGRLEELLTKNASQSSLHKSLKELVSSYDLICLVLY